MAKGNLFLGHAKGKIGDVVLSRVDGRQITRAYNASPSNPKTRPQAIQRAVFATTVAAASGLREIISNSFDGRKDGQDAVNQFIKVNIPRLREAYNNFEGAATNFLLAKGESRIMPQEWQISKGNQGSMYFGTSPWDNGLPLPTSVVNEETGYNLASFRNLWPLIGAGSQLTFVFLLIQDNGNWFEIVPRYYRLVFNQLVTQIGDALILTSTGEFTDIGREVVDFDKSIFYSQIFPLPMTFGENDSFPRIEIDELGVVGFGIIGTNVDETSADGYVHTTSVMSVNMEPLEGWDGDVIPSYMSAAKRVQSSDYYTQQAQLGDNDTSNVTLEQAVSGIVSATGMASKQVSLGTGNTYGPVAEGEQVRFEFTVPQGFRIPANTTTISNGDAAVTNQWAIVRSTDGTYLSLSGPMPTTTSFIANISFDVYNTTDSSRLGRAAVRCTISKANS